MKRTFCRLFIAAILLLFAGSSAETAEDITDLCRITSPKRKTGNVHDGMYTSYWSSLDQKNPVLEFTSPESQDAFWLYICFGDIPDEWVVESEENGKWMEIHRETAGYAHVLVPLEGTSHFRLIDATGNRTKLKINEVSIFGEGEPPAWVQRWEPPEEKADLMLVAAHPDDELIFFGGMLPLYSTELKKRVVLVTMSYSNTTRRSELLNGLWSMGVRKYPVIGNFHDTFCSKLEAAYERWRQKDVDAFLAEQIRRYRPEVVVTHDVKGEYGHGAHKLCADAVQRAVKKCGERGYESSSADAYGVWDVKKLYLHLAKENGILMDWRVPLESLGGKTALEAAQEAYRYHVTQSKTEFKVTDEGETGNASFGLVYTTVGPDEAGGDFLEHIALDGKREEMAIKPESGVETPALPDEAEPVVPEGEPASEKVNVSAVQPVNGSAGYGKAKADVAWPIAKPELDEYGYPQEGEHILEDPEKGLWFYASPTLIVRIDRIHDEEKVLTWYEAHIFCDRDKERFGSILYNPEKPQKKHVQAELIAKQHQVVFAMNTDYYTYRLGRKTMIGMIIRDRQVFFDRVPEANRRQFPNLDTLAMYEDGRWAVFRSDELKAEQYLADGAVDVFSFGPYLVRDGEPNPFVEKMKNGKTEQPRCAIGMIAPGHYYAVLAEGRMKKISVGVNIDWLQEHMLAAGCREALNLDGGQTALMTFMGTRITRIGRYAGGRTTPRETTEIMGIGFSAQIDPNGKLTK
ncbi:MAG: phosphodiester glycosidase family protein [Clostridiales bacterium]|nr:phosphodiester glycosidase family protein [Clostridiales bacterium]